MDDFIRKIVEIDTALRARVDESAARLAQLREQDTATPSEPVNAAQEATAILEAARTAAAEEVRKLEGIYTQWETMLHKRYDENRAEWAEQLAARAIDTPEVYA